MGLGLGLNVPARVLVVVECLGRFREEVGSSIVCG